MPDFETLVARHQGAVCAVAYAILRDRGRSEEIAQEAFLVAWQKLPGMNPQPSLPGWVCGIARNLARNAARRRRPEDPMTDVAADQTTVLDHMLAAERDQLTQRALAMLGESEREAVVLYYRGDESLPEVAAALGITTEAAKKRVQRGRSHLREAISAVEASLRESRPSAAFTAGCVAALAIAAAKPAAAAPMAGGVKLAIAGVAVLAIGAGTFAVSRGGGADEHREIARIASGVATTATTASPGSASPRLEAARAKQIAAAAAGSSSTSASPPAMSTVFPDLQAADRVYDFSGSSLATPLPPIDEQPAIPFGKRELRGMLAQAQPLLQACVAKSGDARKETLDVRVRLEGKLDATVATHARLDGALASNQALAQCVEDALLTISLPGYPIDDVVDIDYPFTP